MDEEIFLKVKRDVLQEEAKKNGSTENMNIVKAYLFQLVDRLLTEEEEKAFIRLIRSGHEEARDLFIKLNLRLVVNAAKRYANFGLDFIDLIDEGNIGLLIALEKFDPEKGNKFSTYASEWILQSIKRAISKYSRTIRVSDSIYWKRLKYFNILRECEVEEKAPPTPEEMAAILNVSMDTLAIISGNNDVSVNYSTMLKDEYNVELLDIITASSVDPLEEQITKKMLQSEVKELIDKVNLNPREKEIISLSLGLDSRRELSQSDIARIYNVSRERVRQICNNVIRKFIEYQGMEDYAVYMDNPDRAVKYLEERRKEL